MPRVEVMWMTGFSLAIDCSDPEVLMRFWADALGYVPQPPPEGFDDWATYFRHIGVPEEELQGATDVYLVDPAGVGPKIFFQEVPEPKVVKNRIHFDLNASGGRGLSMEVRKQRVNAEAERLVRAGATRLRVDDSATVDHYFVVLQDPEGNEFCIN
jgi:hypothetical protein